MYSPKISVVIPTLQEEKYLHIALDSLRNQSFKNFEIIIADGGSTDNTLKIAKKYTDKIFILKDANVCQARDLGTRYSKAEIIAGMDADTYYPQNYLAKLLEIYSQNKDIIAITGKIYFQDAPLWIRPVWWFFYKIFSLVYKFNGTVLYAPALHLSFRKSAFIEIGGYNTNLDFGGDELDFLARLKKVGDILYIQNPIPLTHSRRLKTGFLNFFFNQLIYNYWLNYLTAKLIGKAIIRAKPVR